jgi:hypothetical protein
MNALSPAPSATALLDPPIAVLIEPSNGVCSSVSAVLAQLGYRVCITNELTDDLDRAALAIVEADRASRAVGLIRRLHALRPDLPIVGVLPWWTEEEVDLLGSARYILHVPIRDDQLRGLEALALDLLAAPVGG